MNTDKSEVTDSGKVPSVGQRVRLTHDVERYPHFIAKAGSTGTVSFVDEKRQQINVKLDQHLDGCEEWDNEIIWDGEDCEYFPIQTEALQG